MTRPKNARPSTPPAARTPSPRHRGAGGTLLGVFVGLVLGLGLAAGVAYYLMRAGSPFPVTSVGKDARETPRDPAKVARTDKFDPATDKPRFDFYKILPGTDESKAQPDAKKAPDRAVVDAAKERGAADKAAKSVEKSIDKVAEKPADKSPDKVASVAAPTTVKAGERFWLQAGSFTTEADAENLKARLAFSGWQANVQPGTIPDKGVRFRVRLGPYDNTDELNRIRNDLTRNGFDVAVIKY
ncbi:MAG: SPOR domain-containing protein [Betaproteobacteria bacterium]